MESEKTNDAGVAPGGGPEKKPETVTGFVFAAKEAAEEGLLTSPWDRLHLSRLD